MATKKLEITQRLEDLAKQRQLGASISILNLPTEFYCGRGCGECVARETTQGAGEPLTEEQIKKVIDFFVKNYSTQFITVNGRGDPFDPRVKEVTLNKVKYAHLKGVQSYVFTAGDNLDEETVETLVEAEANVMISLFDNQFIDADFFQGNEFAGKEAKIAQNIRRLIRAYQQSKQQPKEGLTRVGMNYVVSEQDICAIWKLTALKNAANKQGVSFICNTNFNSHDNPRVQQFFENLAQNNSDFRLRHSTYVAGRCQMGAGSSVTVDYDGTLLGCPYKPNTAGSEKIQELSGSQIKIVLAGLSENKNYVCVVRKTSLRNI